MEREWCDWWEREVRRTARMRNSTILFVEARPRAEETAAAKEEVSSVVVLESTKSNRSVTQGHLYRNDRERKREGAQLRENPIERRASTARGRQRKPGSRDAHYRGVFL